MYLLSNKKYAFKNVMSPHITPKSPRRLQRARAFTLIELLTVVAMIGILSAILIPTVGMVKKRSNAAKGISNLRQIGVALNMYSSENKGALPYAQMPLERWNAKYPDILVGSDQPWTVQLSEYLPFRSTDPTIQEHGAYVCPNANYTDDSGASLDEANINRTYAGTDAFYGKDGDGNYSDAVQRRMINVSSPSEVLIVIDAQQSGSSAECDAVCQWQQAQSDMSGAGSNSASNIDFRQPSDSFNALYLDGHVSAIRFDDASALNEYKWNGRAEALSGPSS